MGDGTNRAVEGIRAFVREFYEDQGLPVIGLDNLWQEMIGSSDPDKDLVYRWRKLADTVLTISAPSARRQFLTLVRKYRRSVRPSPRSPRTFFPMYPYFPDATPARQVRLRTISTPHASIDVRRSVRISDIPITINGMDIHHAVRDNDFVRFVVADEPDGHRYFRWMVSMPTAEDIDNVSDTSRVQRVIAERHWGRGAAYDPFNLQVLLHSVLEELGFTDHGITAFRAVRITENLAHDDITYNEWRKGFAVEIINDPDAVSLVSRSPEQAEQHKEEGEEQYINSATARRALRNLLTMAETLKNLGIVVSWDDVSVTRNGTVTLGPTNVPILLNPRALASELSQRGPIGKETSRYYFPDMLARSIIADAAHRHADNSDDERLRRHLLSSERRLLQHIAYLTKAAGLTHAYFDDLSEDESLHTTPPVEVRQAIADAAFAEFRRFASMQETTRLSRAIDEDEQNVRGAIRRFIESMHVRAITPFLTVFMPWLIQRSAGQNLLGEANRYIAQAQEILDPLNLQRYWGGLWMNPQLLAAGNGARPPRGTAGSAGFRASTSLIGGGVMPRPSMSSITSGVLRLFPGPRR